MIWNVLSNCKRWNRKRSSCPSLCIAMRELCQTNSNSEKGVPPPSPFNFRDFSPPQHDLLPPQGFLLCDNCAAGTNTTVQRSALALDWTPPPDINWLGAVALPLLDWLAPSPKLLAGVHSASSSSTPHPSENLIVLVGFVRSRSYGPPSSFFAPTAEPPRTGRTFATTIIGAWW